MRTRTLSLLVLSVLGITLWIFLGDSGTTLAHETDEGTPRQTLPISSGPPSDRLTEGIRLLAHGEASRAEAIFVELVDAKRDLPASLVFLGRARLQRGNVPGARAAAQVVVQHFPDGRDREQARLLLQACDEREAVVSSELPGGTDPQSLSTEEGRSASLAQIDERVRAGELDQARELVQASLETLARFGGAEEAWGRIEPFVKRLDGIQAQRVFDPRSSFWTTSHSLASGETLSHVTAASHRRGHTGFGVGFLQAVNRIRDPRTVPAGRALKIPHLPLNVEVYRDARVVLVYADRELVRVYPCAIGKEGHETPSGEFVIREKDPKPHWYSPEGGRVPYGHPDNPLGEGWLGFEDTNEHEGYGIHGNNDAQSIGKRASRGCVRLRNEDVVELFSWLPNEGTRVVIH